MKKNKMNEKKNEMIIFVLSFNFNTNKISTQLFYFIVFNTLISRIFYFFIFQKINLNFKNSISFSLSIKQNFFNKFTKFKCIILMHYQ